MDVTVVFRPKRRDPETVVLADGATVADLMEAVGEPVHTCVALVAGVLAAEDHPLVDGAEVTLVSAASGG